MRRKAIRHEDQVFAPAPPAMTAEEEAFLRELYLAAPFLAFIAAGYVWMILDMLGL